MTVTLASLAARTGTAVLDHLERSVTIPVVDGLQAQGDLIVVPYDVLAGRVEVFSAARWTPVPPEGVELLRGVAGGHAHTLVAAPGTCRWAAMVPAPARLTLGVFEAAAVVCLVRADPGTCRWTAMVTDPDRLTLGVFEATEVVYLIHAEHGATGSAPGRYVVRRQRELEGHRARMVAD